VLFGGTFATPGWFFFSFGMIFVWIFAGKGDYTSAFVMRGNLESTRAVVTAVEDTHSSEGGGKGSRGTPIYAYHYKFNTGGTDYVGISYRAGGVIAPENGNVTVEFPVGNPGYSRIKGMRRAPFSAFVALVLIFPVAGLAIALPGVWQGWKSIGLLTDGETAQGSLIKKERTNVSVNKRIVYKLTFEFTDRNGQIRQAIAKTHLPEKLEANRLELLFYDPNNSANSTLLDNLPGKQALTDRGELQPCGLWAGLRAVIGPIVGLAVVVGGLLIKALFLN
jgi:hypothetical protein